MRTARQPDGGKPGHHRVEGVITLMQEDRFTLLCNDGTYRLFLLAHDCPADIGELEAAMRDQARVVVDCEAAEDLIAAQAHHVYRAAEQTGTRA